MFDKSRIIKFVIDYKKKHNGNSPSYDEIMMACKITSKSVMKYLLDSLETDGLLEHDGVRNIVIPNSTWKQTEE